VATADPFHRFDEKRVAMYMTSRVVLNCNLAGFSHYDGILVAEKLRIGTRLKLIAESDNPYDPDAVAVMYRGRKIGYVPRAENGRLSQMLNLGYRDTFEVYINRVSWDAHPERQIGMTVRFRDARDLSALSEYGL